MKKIINILLISTLFFINTIQVNACPHIDPDHVNHFQFYNESYTIMSMMYPKPNYLYSKDIKMNSSGKNPYKFIDDILSEKFGFAIMQDKQEYWNNYYFTDERLLEENWEDLDIKTTVEGLEKQEVKGDKFTLEIYLKNSFDDSLTKAESNIDTVYYNIIATNIAKEETETVYTILTDNVLEIKGEYMFTDSNPLASKTDIEDLKKLKDKITVYIESPKTDKTFIAVNLDKELGKDTIISATYDNGYYKFDINESGKYAIIEEPTFIPDKAPVGEIDNDDYIVEEEEEIPYQTTSNNNQKIFISTTITLVIVILIADIFIFKRRSK